MEVRLDRILSKSGYGSRAEVKKLIRAGRVTVDGVKAKSPSDKAEPEKVLVDGKTPDYKEFIYILMNKPQGVICATEDNFHKTVLDLLDERYLKYKPSPVGRLDIDTEGLLLITNDGTLTHNLLSPVKHIPKTYFAKIEKPLSDNDIKAICDGVDIGEGYITKPAEIQKTEDGILLTIHEGKFHQVKRMLEAVSNKVTFLKRISMGKVTLPDTLKTGEYIEISNAEKFFDI